MKCYLDNLSLQQLGSGFGQRNKNVVNKFKKSGMRAMESVSGSYKLPVEGEMDLPSSPFSLFSMETEKLGKALRCHSAWAIFS